MAPVRYANNPSRAVELPGGVDEAPVRLAGAVELSEKLDHTDTGVEVGVRLEPVKCLAGEDLLAGLRDEPVVEEHR